MKNFFKELFQYNFDTSQQLIKTMLESTTQLPEKSIKLKSHIFNAHQIWNARIEQKQPGCAVWDLREINDYRAIDTVNYENTLLILDQVDLDHVLPYVNFKGDKFQNKVRDILFHVINHSNYHRAQIISNLKEHGIATPVTDYIFYKR